MEAEALCSSLRDRVSWVSDAVGVDVGEWMQEEGNACVLLRRRQHGAESGVRRGCGGCL